ncbi:MAG TPA: DNRLRE domain-containing protein, partial [Acidimicrobiales bacterium]|nr:DNRLRE domain-containing protein [Acidimicrobiales bacterium]
LELALTPDGFKETVVLPDAASPPTYLDRFVLPAGMGARQGADGVEFTDASGAVVASFGGGFAFAADFPAGGADTTAPVAVRLVAAPTATDRAATVEVGVDAAWLATPDRAFPVRVDPIFQQNTAAGAAGRDTYVQSGAYQNTAFGSSTAIVSGTDPNGYISRSLLYFNLGSLPSSTRIVTSATLGVYNWYSPSCSARQTDVYGLGGGFSNSTTWATQPPLDGAGVMSSLSFARGASGCVADWAHFDITPLARRWVTDAAPNYGLALRAANEADSAAIRYYWSFEANGYVTSPAISITYNTLPGIATPVSPAQADPNEPAVVYTATPTLEVNPATDPDGDPVQYFFRITEHPDAELGSKTEGLPTSSTTFAVPPGALRDGVTYYWHAWTKDPTHWRQPDWVRSFRVDLRLGAGVEATDAYGPAAVNLATGNLNVRVDSPSFATLAGPLGVSYTYNSLAEANTGLTGRYYNDPAVTRDFAGKTEALVRRDTDLNFEWGVDQSPAPGVAATNYLVRWDGFVTAPGAAGTYRFSAGHDDGVRIWVGGTLVVDRWLETNYNGDYAGGVWFAAGERKAIRIEYNQQAGRAIMTLVAQGPFGPGGAMAQSIVPASWLTAEATALPKGWSLSAGVGGDGAYTGARGSGGSATVVDASGRAHNFAATNPGFRPPAGREAVLGRAGNGTLGLRADDGSAFAFDVAGQMSAVATEGGSPAAPGYTWSGNRLRQVTDPAANRSIAFHYGGAAACPTTLPPGFSPAPTGMLCRVAYWDNTATEVFYV